MLAKHRGAFERALVMTESVFSMDGDRAPSPRSSPSAAGTVAC